MRVGSIVNLVEPKTIEDYPPVFRQFVKEIPQMNVDYTVGEITKCDCCGEHYVEIDQIQPIYVRDEGILPLPMNWFREVDLLGNSLTEEVKEEVTS